MANKNLPKIIGSWPQGVLFTGETRTSPGHPSSHTSPRNDRCPLQTAQGRIAVDFR
jgi:hypothetical protein